MDIIRFLLLGDTLIIDALVAGTVVYTGDIVSEVDGTVGDLDD
jgi:hypothetical protein